MPSTRRLLKLSHDEEIFLHHWMYDEVHFGEGQGPAKRLQVQHHAVPANLAVLIAASIPEPSDQEAAGLGPPPAEPPSRPWPGDTLRLAAGRCPGRSGGPLIRVQVGRPWSG
jgi:hypothetical protein